MRAASRSIVLALPLLAALPARADTNCAAAGDQTSMNICADRDFQAADHRLNETYRALLQAVSKPGLLKLQKAQRAWIAWRDAQCDFVSSHEDGPYSAQPMVRAICVRVLTEQQTKLLDGQLHCPEGDLECGGQ